MVPEGLLDSQRLDDHLNSALDAPAHQAILEHDHQITSDLDHPGDMVRLYENDLKATIDHCLQSMIEADIQGQIRQATGSDHDLDLLDIWDPDHLVPGEGTREIDCQVPAESIWEIDYLAPAEDTQEIDLLGMEDGYPKKGVTHH